MSTYRKYNFETEKKYSLLIEQLDKDVEFISLPRVCIKEPAIIENGKVIKEAVLETTFSIDILWNEEEPKKFVKYQVWPKGVGQYIIGGWEGAYEADRKKALGIVEPELNIRK